MQIPTIFSSLASSAEELKPTYIAVFVNHGRWARWRLAAHRCQPLRARHRGLSSFSSSLLHRLDQLVFQALASPGFRHCSLAKIDLLTYVFELVRILTDLSVGSFQISSCTFPERIQGFGTRSEGQHGHAPHPWGVHSIPDRRSS